jgi:hypothetical protein
MSYTLEWLSDESIVIVSIQNPIDAREDPRAIVADIAAIQREHTEDIYLILDTTGLEIKFTDIVFMLANTFIGKMPEGLNRDKLHRTLVSTHRLAQMWVEGSKQSQYGGYNYNLTTTREDALAAVRATIQKTMGATG